MVEGVLGREPTLTPTQGRLVPERASMQAGASVQQWGVALRPEASTRVPGGEWFSLLQAWRRAVRDCRRYAAVWGLVAVQPRSVVSAPWIWAGAEGDEWRRSRVQGSVR